MKAASRKQIGFILGLAKNYEHLNYEWSDFTDKEGNVTITYSDANDLIKELNGGDESANNMRRKIISMARTMGWTKAGKADMERIDNWCSKYGKFHKKLNAHTYKELVELVTQFQYGMLNKTLEENVK